MTRSSTGVVAVSLVASLAVGGFLAACSPAPAPPASDGAAPVSMASGAPLAGPVFTEELDPPQARVLRTRLVASIREAGPPWGNQRWDQRVLDALQRVPRHLFVPGASLPEAYEDRPLPIGHGQTISQPAVVAIMTASLDLRGDERVLEIGTGSGYQAAVLSVLARRVLSIEIVEPLGRAAGERLSRLGYRNVEVRIGDGYAGWPEHAPFDRIIVTAAPPEVPRALVDQLADGGVLVAPVGDAHPQKLVRWRKRGDRIEKEDLGAVLFVPMVPGAPGDAGAR